MLLLFTDLPRTQCGSVACRR